MKLTLTFASTLNGKITKGDDPDVTKWTSKEDQAHFKKVQAGFPVVIRSSSTYKIAKDFLDKSGKQRHIVMTRDPSKFESEKIDGVLEFTSESPNEIVERLEREGVEKALLAAGGTIVSLFLKKKLIDSFFLTLEPKMFGNGIPMLAESDLEADFELESFERLNPQGTLILKYKLLKN